MIKAGRRRDPAWANCCRYLFASLVPMGQNADEFSLLCWLISNVNLEEYNQPKGVCGHACE